ncbi:MAG TPA: hypothetical protein VGC54_14115, partial [Planctomycetota bacterium]
MSLSKSMLHKGFREAVGNKKGFPGLKSNSMADLNVAAHEFSSIEVDVPQGDGDTTTGCKGEKEIGGWAKPSR